MGDETTTTPGPIAAAPGPPRWRPGRPEAPGIWVLRMETGDLVTATVRWDEYEVMDTGNDTGTIHRHLRIDDGEMSEELDRVDGEIGRWVACSFGPIPFPSLHLGEDMNRKAKSPRITQAHMVKLARQMRAARLAFDNPRCRREAARREALRLLRSIERAFDVASAQYDSQSGALATVRIEEVPDGPSEAPDGPP